MVETQLKYLAQRETQRNNLATEKETNRHNVAVEAETARNNLATLAQTATRDKEVARNNKATLKEQVRTHKANEKLTKRGQDVTAKSSALTNQTSKENTKLTTSTNLLATRLTNSMNYVIAAEKNATTKSVEQMRNKTSLALKEIDKLMNDSRLRQSDRESLRAAYTELKKVDKQVAGNANSANIAKQAKLLTSLQGIIGGLVLDKDMGKLVGDKFKSNPAFSPLYEIQDYQNGKRDHLSPEARRIYNGAYARLNKDNSQRTVRKDARGNILSDTKYPSVGSQRTPREELARRGLSSTKSKSKTSKSSKSSKKGSK